MNFTQKYMAEVAVLADVMDYAQIESCVSVLASVKKSGRLFILGVGGSAANASHAVNDFRKIGGFEAYAPTDNVAELTARINDQGWSCSMSEWLRGSRLNDKDCVMILSVGGGSVDTSYNLVTAMTYAKTVGARIIGIVGRDGGQTKRIADACILIPTVNDQYTTPHVESFQAVLWHLMVNHPSLK